VEPVRPRIVPPAVPAVAPTATRTIEVRTNVTERGRVLRGRTGNEVIGEINPQPLELPRPRGAAQAFRIEVDGYETAVVELHEGDPPVVLVPLSESPRRRHHRADAAPPGAHARPLAPLVPTAPTPPAHTDGLRDPWNN